VVELTAGVPVMIEFPTSISVSAARASLVQGQVETLTATVTTPSGYPTPTASFEVALFSTRRARSVPRVWR